MHRVSFLVGLLMVTLTTGPWSAARAQDAATPRVSPAVMVAPAEVVSEITGGTDPLERPSGLAVAANGTLYMIDAERDHIRVFDADGQPVATWGETGSAPGQFLFSADIILGDLAMAPDGSLYVLDPNSNRIQKFTADGAFVLAWGELGSEPGQFLYPGGIGVDGEGHVYVADGGNHRVQVFDGAGAFLAAWDGTKGGGAPIEGPADVAVDAAGMVWVTDAILHRVVGLDAGGTVVTSFGQIGDGPGEMRGPWGIVVDVAGQLYVAEYDGDRVQVFNPDGTSVGIVGERGEAAGQFNAPSYLAVAPDGLLAVADEGNHRVQVFRLLAPLAPATGTPVSS